MFSCLNIDSPVVSLIVHEFIEPSRRHWLLVKWNDELQSIPYVDVSPSKRLRKRSLDTSVTTSAARKPDVIETSTNDVDAESGNLDLVDIVGGEHDDGGKEKSSQYALRKQKEAEAWSGIREQMLRVSVEASCLPPSSLCSICGRPASVRCKVCGPITFYCEPCTEATHSLRHPLHTPEIWKVSSVLTIDHMTFVKCWCQVSASYYFISNGRITCSCHIHFKVTGYWEELIIEIVKHQFWKR